MGTKGSFLRGKAAGA